MKDETKSNLISCGIVILFLLALAYIGKYAGIVAIGKGTNGVVILPLIGLLSAIVATGSKKIAKQFI